MRQHPNVSTGRTETKSNEHLLFDARNHTGRILFRAPAGAPTILPLSRPSDDNESSDRFPVP
jgi:hypothetical protein